MGRYPTFHLYWGLKAQLQCVPQLDSSLQQTGRPTILYRGHEWEMVLALGDACGGGIFGKDYGTKGFS